MLYHLIYIVTKISVISYSKLNCWLVKLVQKKEIRKNLELIFHIFLIAISHLVGFTFIVFKLCAMCFKYYVLNDLKNSEIVLVFLNTRRVRSNQFLKCTTTKSVFSFYFSTEHIDYLKVTFLETWIHPRISEEIKDRIFNTSLFIIECKIESRN